MHYKPTHHTIVSVDVAGSGSLDDRQQLRMRADLRSMINGTLSLQSLDRAPVDRADLGDGMRLIFPAEISPCSLLDPFVPNLASTLRRYRETAADSLRLRLRVAVHAGLLHRDKGGWAGAPLVHCARLIDARPVRRALRLADQADLVLVVSQAMYESVVRHGYGLNPSMYRRLVIREKETSATAWLYIPGEVQPAESSRSTTKAPTAVVDSSSQLYVDFRSPGFQSLDVEPAGRQRKVHAGPSNSTALTAESMIGAAHGQSASPITLVGRDEELSAVLNMLTALGTGRGGVLWVEGEPGIGKSTLISAALSEASAQGFSVRVAVGDELSQRLPLRSLLDATGDAASEVAAILHAGVGHSLPYAADSLPAAIERFLVVVDRLCTIAPMVLAFDDLQCADDASLTAWHRLSLAVDQIPLLLISACRPIPVRPAIAALRRGAIDRGAIVVSLNPLDDGQIAQLVGQLAHAEPGPRLCRTMARAGGNPLYSRELLDALTREGRVQVDGGIAELVGELGQAPKGLAGAVRSRLDFLSPDATLILRIAALLGPNFSVSDLTTVAGRPAVDLVPVLDEAFTAGVLTEAGEQLQFRHGLIREAMQETTPASARSALHQQIARTLANAGLPTDRVAVHLAAAPDGIDGWALDWLASAAPVLTNQAPQLAAELLQHAVDRTPAADARWEGLVAALTRASHRLGRGGEAEKYARSALAHVRDPGLIAEMRWILGYVQGWAGRPEAITTIEHALDDPGLPRVWRARLQAMLAMVHMLAGHHDAAEATATQALAAGEAAGDRFATGYALHAMAIISGLRRDNGRAAALIDRALAVLADDLDHVDLRLILHHNRIYARTVLDRIAEAETDLGTARQLAERTGNVQLGGVIHLTSAVHYFWTGRWDDTLAELDAAPDLSIRYMLLVSSGLNALLAARRDDRSAAKRWLAAVRDLKPSTSVEYDNCHFVLAARAVTAERDGNPQEALRTVATLLRPEFAQTTLRYWLLPDVVRLALTVNDTATAGGAVDLCEAEATQEITSSKAAAAGHCRGLLTADPSPLLAAADHYRTVGRVVELARVLEDAAVLLASGGDTKAARVPFTEAVDIYTGLGATWDLRRADSRVRPYHIRPGATGPHRRPTHGWNALSPTEVAIARLVARGLSNPDVATELLLSRRTVQSHVSHILVKLDIHSRREIAQIVSTAITKEFREP